MDSKFVLVALIIIVAGLAFNSANKDVEIDSIDELIERLEHVLETQTLSKKELGDMLDEADEDAIEIINEKTKALRKRWSDWGTGVRSDSSTKRVTNDFSRIKPTGNSVPTDNLRAV